MKYLLDTHVLIWMVSNSKMISQKVATILKNREKKLWFSTVSLWEIAIKSSLGKLQLELSIDELVKELILNDIELFTLNIEHVKNVQTLPFHHRDPFDRMLISQAKSEQMTILTKDANFSLYEVDVIW